MPITQSNYQTLCNSVGIQPKQYNYSNGYTYCSGVYNQYLVSSLRKLSVIKPHNVIFVLLESCPLNTSNYIFKNQDHNISFKTDSYLWNIYTGFMGLKPKNMTKGACLDALLNYKTIANDKIAVILFDLFPFHGIKLSTKIRQRICQNLQSPMLFSDIKQHISNFSNRGKYFLFSVPPTIWNCFSQNYRLLGTPVNQCQITNVIPNQNISSKAINIWRHREGIN